MTSAMHLVRLAALVLCTVLPSSLASQTRVGSASHWAVGGAVGVPGMTGAIGVFSVGVTATQVAPGRVGLDFAAGTLPTSLLDGRLPLGVRLGGALPLTIRQNTSLVPSAGVSLAAQRSQSRWDGGVGLNAGLAMLFESPGTYGFRVGMTVHTFRDVRGGVGLFEMGIVKSGPRAPQ